jgi:hypothetical protein
MEPAELAELLAGLAISSDREHAWISEKALRNWPSLKSEAWWQDGLSNMIAAVQKFGWIDQVNRKRGAEALQIVCAQSCERR